MSRAHFPAIAAGSTWPHALRRARSQENTVARQIRDRLSFPVVGSLAADGAASDRQAVITPQAEAGDGKTLSPMMNTTSVANIATVAEAAAILKLRNRAGWWNGDKQALEVLRKFAAEVRAEAARDVAKTINFNPGGEVTPQQESTSRAA